MTFKISPNKKLIRYSTTIFLIFTLLYAGAFHYANATPIFADQKTLSGTAFAPAVVVNGSTNVHAAWFDTSSASGADIVYSNSTGNFATPLTLTDGTTGNGGVPQIAITGGTVYVAWMDGMGSGIMIAKSTDGGVTFNSPVVTSTIAASVSSFKMFADNGNLYVVWLDGTGNISFASSANAYAITTLDSSTSNHDPVIAASGDHVYVAWGDTALVHPGILYSNSTNAGVDFNVGSPIFTTLNDTSKPNAHPAIAASGSDVYVAWEEQETSAPDDTDISFKASTNNGHNFGIMKNLSNNAGKSQLPQIAASGSSVYVTWLDNQIISSTLPNDVLITSSTNAGASFPGGTINLSANTGDSSNLQISASGANVNVIWMDTTLNPLPGDIFYIGSTNSGTSFGGFVKMNNAPGSVPTTSIPQISSSATNVSVVWDDNTGNIFYKTSTASPISITYDKSQYSQRDTATIKIITTPGQTIHPIVNSTNDGNGFSPTFTETTPGTYTSSVHFNDFGSMALSNSTNSTLRINGAGDTITTSFGGQSAFSSTIPVTVTLDHALYDRGSTAHVTVNDPSANTNPSAVDTITIKLTSKANTAGTTMQLKETGVNTGIFGGTTIHDDNIIFMVNNDLYPVSGSITIVQNNKNFNTTSGIDTMRETVTSTSDTAGLTGGTGILLTETGGLTGIFTGKLHFGGSTIAGSTIKVRSGDIVSINGGGGTGLANGMVLPINATSGALLVLPDFPSDDLLTVNYRGVLAQATITNTAIPGGGSGGVLRASLVVDALASVGGSGSVAPSFSLTNLALAPNADIPANIKNEVLNRDPNVPIAPDRTTQFNFPLIIDGGGYPLAGYSNKIVTVAEKTNTPVDLKLNIPATNLVHLALYTNLHGTENELTKSDTYIIYDKGQPLNIVDPHHYFDHVKFDMTTTKGILNQVDYTITFANPMDKSNIIFRTWNDRSASSDVVVQDAWQVTEGPKLTSSSQLSPLQEQNIPIPQTPSLIPPATSQGTLDIISKIKDWGGYSPNPISDAQLLSDIGIQGQSIPKWAEKIPKMVVDGDLTPQEFEDALKYLASIGAIK